MTYLKQFKTSVIQCSESKLRREGDSLKHSSNEEMGKMKNIWVIVELQRHDDVTML